jgi:hypothetical protein
MCLWNGNNYITSNCTVHTHCRPKFQFVLNQGCGERKEVRSVVSLVSKDVDLMFNL